MGSLNLKMLFYSRPFLFWEITHFLLLLPLIYYYLTFLTYETVEDTQ